MGNWEFCRICTKCIKNGQSQRLFDRNHCKLIRKIEEVTGIHLENFKQLPQCICKPCRKDLEKAYEFRERCIFAQKYFNTVDFKKQCAIANENVIHSRSDSSFELKDELPLEENHSEVICLVKDESCGEIYHNGADPIIIDNCNYENDLTDKLADYTTATDEMEKEAFVVNNTPSLDVKSKKKRAKLEVKQSFRALGKLKMSPGKQKKTDDKAHNFICDQCGNNFTCKHHFITHLRRHTGDKQFQCELCPDKFFTHSELNRHMRRHTGERPFECKHCGRRFSDFSTRIKHERTHTNERPFVCTQCSKAFTTSYILKNHMLIHTGERSFKCNLCNKAFQRQTHLVVHYRSIMHKQKEEKQKQCGLKPINEAKQQSLKYS